MSKKNLKTNKQKKHSDTQKGPNFRICLVISNAPDALDAQSSDFSLASCKVEEMWKFLNWIASIQIFPHPDLSFASF